MSEIKYSELHNREWLFKAYVEQEMSMVEIATDLGCAAWTVSVALTRAEIEHRSKKETSNSGRFQRTHDVWTPEHWNDGYTDNRGRFRVYRPDYPNAYAEGYALRYHIVWWLAGKTIPEGYELHHINENKTDDVFSNLELITHLDHARLHHPVPTSICDHCGNEFCFYRRSDRIRRFCTQKCYQAHRKTEYVNQ